MPTALFVSPHLDDAVFSAGGLAGLLVDRGWTTVLVTAFTRSVVPATGFALACQLDKGLAPDADYMALRRQEDRDATSRLGVSEALWLDLLEAPHRGYDSAPALFGPTHDEDSVRLALIADFIELSARLNPDLVVAPQGLGNHVDHQHVVWAAIACFRAERLAFYRDTPYAIRQPHARPLPSIMAFEQRVVGISAALDRKIAAAQAYTSQVGFQFGGAAALAKALQKFAWDEGDGVHAERFIGCDINALLGTA